MGIIIRPQVANIGSFAGRTSERLDNRERPMPCHAIHNFTPYLVDLTTLNLLIVLNQTRTHNTNTRVHDQPACKS